MWVCEMLAQPFEHPCGGHGAVRAIVYRVVHVGGVCSHYYYDLRSRCEAHICGFHV